MAIRPFGHFENFRAPRHAGATIALMSGAYHQLLDAAIQHLQELKARGVQFVPVAPETLAELKRSRRLAPVRSRTTQPVPAPRAAPLVSRPAPITAKTAQS